VDTDHLRQSLHRLIFARVTILTILLFAHTAETLFFLSNQQDTKLVFFSFAIIYFVSLLNAWWVRKTSSIKHFGYCQFFVDIVFATLAAYIASPLVVVSLYLIIIASASLAFNKHGAIAIASLAGVGFAIIASGALPGVQASGLTSRPADIFAVYIALIATSLISSYVASQLETAKIIAKDNEATLITLSQNQENLLKEVSDGIITIDLESTITGINDAAKAILGLNELDSTAFIGKPINKTLEKHGVAGFKEVLKNKNITTEVSLESSSLDEERHLHCAVKEIAGSKNEAKGKMLIFSDQSKYKDIEKKLHLHERMTELMASPAKDLSSISTGSDSNKIIGQSPAMKKLYSLLGKVSSSEASVLISGESGTGKELIARAIHANSERAFQPFVAVNCGAIPENLIESELFGHKKGAFTGAVNDSIGLFKQADGGTIFLDEIGELPLHLQTKLLRVLQEKVVRAVGASISSNLDVRVVAATNKDLKVEVQESNFRDDLYYRLNVVGIDLPALRARKEDIPLLVRHFVKGFSENSEELPKVSPEALQALNDYDFPGNIRELENIIERAIVLGGNAILAEHLPPEVLVSSSNENSISRRLSNEDSILDEENLPVDLDQKLAKLERQYLENALSQSQGIKKDAAKLLGLNFRSFRYRLKKYSLSDGENN